MAEQKPIGVFDSGLGGLTVLRALRAALPGEDLIYFGDTARVPYGNRSSQTVRRYTDEIVGFLVRHDIKLMVIACNTSSAVALDVAERHGVPVVEVVRPGARAAADRTRNGKIGVIGTRATVESGAYVRALHEINPAFEYLQKACPLFVPLVEEGWTEGEITRKVAEVYLGEARREDIDTLILGCTHYPLLRDAIAEVLGGNVEIVDSAGAVTAVVVELLDRLKLRRANHAAGGWRFYLTDSPGRFETLASRFLGRPLDNPVLVSLAE